MEIVVEITPAARAQLLTMLTSVAPTPLDALVTAVVYCDELERLLTLHQSPPPGSLLWEVDDGASWWLYADGLWFGFTRADETVGRWPFRRVERTFTVFSTATRRPSAGTRPPPG